MLVRITKSALSFVVALAISQSLLVPGAIGPLPAFARASHHARHAHHGHQAAPAENKRTIAEETIKSYLDSHPDEIGQIARDYFIAHPEAFQQVVAEVLKRRPLPAAGAPMAAAPPSVSKAEIVKANAATLFRSTHQVTLGNASGNVTLVEFFDYNCGFCKRGLADMLAMIKSDSGLKVVLKELPVLGPGSEEAARVAIAVRMQDAGGDKYLAFHQKLLGERGYADKARAFAVAQEVGLDMARLENDLASDEVEKSLAEGRALARQLGVTGTPSYVLGEDLVIGAVGATALSDKIALLRK